MAAPVVSPPATMHGAQGTKPPARTLSRTVQPMTPFMLSHLAGTPTIALHLPEPFVLARGSEPFRREVARCCWGYKRTATAGRHLGCFSD